MTDNPKSICVIQKKSSIDRSERQKRTLRALGLRKINQSVQLPNNPAVEGMIRKVAHLVEVKV